MSELAPTDPGSEAEHDSGTGMAAPQEVTAPLGSNYYKLMAASVISNLGDGIGVIAYPWLASAVTRNPVLIALVAAAQRLPWLLFTLPAGVITDRSDRRRLMVGANAARAVLTFIVAGAVLSRQGVLPSPDEAAAGQVGDTDVLLYGLIVLATLLLGMAEVLYDNSAQTFMPSIVDQPNLEKANGRLWSVEMVANNFIGPPLAGVLLVIAFSVPFFVDAVTFAVSAALIAAIAATPREPAPVKAPGVRTSWVTEAKEGFNWLWKHPLLRPLAITLGILNALGTMVFAVIVLFSQEVLDTGTTEFAIMMTGSAVGGIVGGWTASWMSKKLGEGPSLWATMISSGLGFIVGGMASDWPVLWVTFCIAILFGTLWNVITVSLRQTIIPDRLLGRVNSVYRLFGWGMMPIGALIGGVLVTLTEAFGGSRELALRMPFFVSGVGHFVLLIFAAPKLTSAKIRQARVDATS